MMDWFIDGFQFGSGMIVGGFCTYVLIDYLFRIFGKP